MHRMHQGETPLKEPPGGGTRYKMLSQDPEEKSLHHLLPGI
jgi:hypothetical protein